MTASKGTRTMLATGRVVLVCFLSFLNLPMQAQPTNLEAFQQLALRCLATVPDTTQSFVLDASTQMPYLREALATQWLAQGRTLFLADSAAAADLPRLRYTIEEVRLHYAPIRGKKLARTATLALQITFVAPDGRLLLERRCREQLADTLPLKTYRDFENPAFPETQAEVSQSGWMRRYLEPALLATATAITVYLFFNVRNDRNATSQ